jgi:hydrogenase-4 membrane subunit HyfE
MWQDNVIAVCSGFFIITLVYQVVDNFRKKMCGFAPFTSGVTAVALYVMSYAFHTLRLTWSSVSSLVTASLWTCALVQYFAYRRSPEKSETSNGEANYG